MLGNVVRRASWIAYLRQDTGQEDDVALGLDQLGYCLVGCEVAALQARLDSPPPVFGVRFRQF